MVSTSGASNRDQINETESEDKIEEDKRMSAGSTEAKPSICVSATLRMVALRHKRRRENGNRYQRPE
ncbi:hypothetical protein F1880_000967 [Penicillium rolfsii]|nr:hypothetical protein F1880_000967 [Penicillium rolfsii]